MQHMHSFWMFQFHHEWHFERHDSYPVMNRHQELHSWVLPWNISQGNLLLPCFEDRCQSCEDFCYNWLNVNPVYVAGWMMKQLLELFWTWSWNPWSWKLIHGDSEIMRDFSFMLSRLGGAQKPVLWNCRGAHDFLWARSLCWADLLSQKFIIGKMGLLEFSSDPYKRAKTARNRCSSRSWLYNLFVHLSFSETWVNVCKCVIYPIYPCHSAGDGLSPFFTLYLR